jgi:hypothetical protein
MWAYCTKVFLIRKWGGKTHWREKNEIQLLDLWVNLEGSFLRMKNYTYQLEHLVTLYVWGKTLHFELASRVKRDLRSHNIGIKVQVQPTSFGPTVYGRNKLSLLQPKTQCVRRRLFELSHISYKRDWWSFYKCEWKPHFLR